MGALDVIREQLPKFFQEDQAEGLRNVMSAVFPQDATDLGIKKKQGGLVSPLQAMKRM